MQGGGGKVEAQCQCVWEMWMVLGRSYLPLAANERLRLGIAWYDCATCKRIQMVQHVSTTDSAGWPRGAALEVLHAVHAHPVDTAWLTPLFGGVRTGHCHADVLAWTRHNS